MPRAFIIPKVGCFASDFMPSSFQKSDALLWTSCLRHSKSWMRCICQACMLSFLSLTVLYQNVLDTLGRIQQIADGLIVI